MQIKSLSPSRYLAGGFAAMILTGTFLLSLPFSTVEGKIHVIDALFTATSAVCVTGLVVVDTGTYFTLAGQLIIMLLILGGALGFMTMATLIFVLLGRRITLKDRLIIKEALQTDSIQGVVSLIISVVKMSLTLILAGSVLLGLRFIPRLGWEKGLLFSVFHAVSAFGNAGFDLFGDFQSLTAYTGDYLVSGTILLLFVVGGLGYPVILELLQHKKTIRYSLHTRLVLLFTAVLLFLGTAVILLMEYANPETLGGLGFANKIFAAFFTAATPRTAGFNVIPTDALTTPVLLFLLLLMFIGASPASTGGGVKTTTFVLLLTTVRALTKGSDEVVLYEKHVPSSLILKALAVLIISISLIFFMIFAVSIVEHKPFLDLTFEVFSAFGTVGLSMGITPTLSNTGRLLIIITMFAGRIGPLTLLYALTRRFNPGGIKYPEERILIG
ncbi:MAG: TrkH family potassium uptake protein [Bacillota bacterium]